MPHKKTLTIIGHIEQIKYQGIHLIDYLYGREDILLPWVKTRIDGMLFDGDAKAIGVARDGEIIACVVFDEFCRFSCQIAVASDGRRRWLSRQYLVRIFAYPFLQCGLRRIGGLVSEKNEPSIKLIRGVGFKQEGIIRQAGYEGEDLIAFGMLREECRFLI